MPELRRLVPAYDYDLRCRARNDILMSFRNIKGTDVLAMTPVQRIVRDISEAITSGRADLGLIEKSAEFAFLSQSLSGESSADAESFQRFFKNNPSLVKAAAAVTLVKALGFLEAEFERFQRIKLERELTREEKDYGNTTLLPLLASLVQMRNRMIGSNSGDSRQLP